MNGAKTAVQTEAERRSARRADDFRRAKGLHEGISRRSGSHIYGLDEEGRLRQTRNMESFKITMDRWTVYLRFKHEDRQVLDSMPVSEIEKKVKDGDVPRKLVNHKTHIIRAVRLQKHIRKGYERELAETDALLRSMDEANHALAGIKRKHSDSDLDAAIAVLKCVDEALSRKQVVVKRLLTRERVQKAAQMLEEAKKLEGNKRDFHVSRACAVFTSARNRLGAWRDKQVAGIAEYNAQKEHALRLERDRWIASQLARFSEIPEKVYEWCMFDRHKLSVLDELERMLSPRKPDWDSILTVIKANHPLFRVGKRARDGAEKKILEMESGIQPSEHGKTDYLIGHYGWLYRFASKKQKQEALEKIEYLRLFVNGNKPAFIYEELAQEPDLYLGPVLEPLGRALAQFDARNFKEAAKLFSEAWNAIGLFANSR